MRNTYGFLILLLCLLFGNILTLLIPVAIPGSIYGMGIFLAGLVAGVIPEEIVDAICESLLLHMNLFFAPGAVNLILVYPSIRGTVLKILFVTVVSTILVIISTGLTTQFLARRKEARRV
ncbi:Putative effector of murein hydrolase LrgA [Aedoeadaptatus ivorii]|uniref:Effector of murein hydrolase LrgA n=1 Tax=Aedoeadaptatus ivorii TaxID=54006 RepID=A0A448UZJ7_9FIRM|nr:CidA/LrgA family protein [Peptoniphilus ivorii]MDQ0508541.1 holin-like protein [Peptoniphilus ivorii]VEJ34376.1 Putative effector of murein hydrolase LrgA [Peptoniphilus ivorii]